MSKSRRSIANDLAATNNPNLVRIHDDSGNDNRPSHDMIGAGDYLCLLDGLLIKPGSPAARNDPNKKPRVGFLRNSMCFLLFGSSMIMVYFIISCIGSGFVFIEDQDKELPGSSMTTTRTTTSMVRETNQIANHVPEFRSNLRMDSRSILGMNVIGINQSINCR